MNIQTTVKATFSFVTIYNLLFPKIFFFKYFSASSPISSIYIHSLIKISMHESLPNAGLEKNPEKPTPKPVPIAAKVSYEIITIFTTIF